jgi:2-polyprenyl-3-methyl-5-hydroxy-6-metoxy-1,4-benzoquinol methylase
MTTSQVASREEVEAFLASTSFDGYQSVPLPHGLSVPGKDRSQRTEQVLGRHVAGRSVLDIGTNYGVFPFEAMQRGASRAVGIELDESRAAMAQRIAALHGDSYEIRQGRVEDLAPEESFDVVLVLNVLHHLLDPIAVMRQLAAVCRETMIVEFCLPDDPEYLIYVVGRSAARTRLNWVLAGLRSRLLRRAIGDLPLMAVGNRSYDRTFYFSPAAFENLFVLHQELFESVSFEPSVTGQRRVVATCRIRRAD